MRTDIVTGLRWIERAVVRTPARRHARLGLTARHHRALS